MAIPAMAPVGSEGDDVGDGVGGVEGTGFTGTGGGVITGGDETRVTTPLLTDADQDVGVGVVLMMSMPVGASEAVMVVRPVKASQETAVSGTWPPRMMFV